VNSELRRLYQDIILDHNRRPRNHHSIITAQTAEGHNPLCGDHLTVYVRIEGGRIENASFTGSGCAISKASASVMTETVKGRTVIEAYDLFHRFAQMITGASDDAGEDLGTLSAFAGVRQFPIRVKCATLPWHTLCSAIGTGHEVSNE
jgi:nitrogen fixation protein NifU and related proteins